LFAAAGELGKRSYARSGQGADDVDGAPTKAGNLSGVENTT
jgi:hypothetical protein